MTNPTSSGDFISLPKSASTEAEELSAAILEDIELSKVPLSVVVLKTLRLTRLLNDFDAQQIFEWESSGYPDNASGAGEEVSKAARSAGRSYYGKDSKSGASKRFRYIESVEGIEGAISIAKTSLQTSDIQRERLVATRTLRRMNPRLAQRRSFIYQYTLRKHYELKFAGLADGIFERIRSSVDVSIGELVPDAVRKLVAAHENLASDNPEDWANAVHSCRRILQDLADALFPARSETRTRNVEGKDVEIKLGNDQYINRLLAYIEDMAESERFVELVGSNLRYMRDRLQAVLQAANKGSHASVTKEEADRYVIYTYLLVGDILSLGTITTQNVPEAVEDDSLEAELDEE